LVKPYPIQLFALVVELATKRINVHVDQDTLEINVNGLFASLKTHLTAVFVQEMVFVSVLMSASVIQIMMEINANITLLQ
jgi:iron-sulfur cluster repair protein YtfE (RIC family)